MIAPANSMEQRNLNLYTFIFVFFCNFGSSDLMRVIGEVAEWLKAHAWKACICEAYRGFESLSLRLK